MNEAGTIIYRHNSKQYLQDYLFDPQSESFILNNESLRAVDIVSDNNLDDGPRTTESPKSCCGGFSRPNLVKWLGIYWYGTPFPLRIRFNMYGLYWLRDKDCGCIAYLKDRWIGLKYAYLTYKRFTNLRQFQLKKENKNE